MGISALLNNEQIRRTNRDSKSWYAATDVVAVLTDSQHPDEYWDHILDVNLNDFVAANPSWETQFKFLPLLRDPKSFVTVGCSHAEQSYAGIA